MVCTFPTTIRLYYLFIFHSGTSVVTSAPLCIYIFIFFFTRHPHHHLKPNAGLIEASGWEGHSPTAPAHRTARTTGYAGRTAAYQLPEAARVDRPPGSTMATIKPQDLPPSPTRHPHRLNPESTPSSREAHYTLRETTNITFTSSLSTLTHYRVDLEMLSKCIVIAQPVIHDFNVQDALFVRLRKEFLHPSHHNLLYDNGIGLS